MNDAKIRSHVSNYVCTIFSHSLCRLPSEQILPPEKVFRPTAVALLLQELLNLQSLLMPRTNVVSNPYRPQYSCTTICLVLQPATYSVVLDRLSTCLTIHIITKLALNGHSLIA